MADFATYTLPTSFTTVVTAGTALSDVTPVSTTLIPCGAGQFPYENYITGVDFIANVTVVTATGNMTVTFQASYDNVTWFTVSTHTWVGALPTSTGTKFHFPVWSREWRFIRAQFQVANPQGGSPSTIQVRAKAQGLQVPFTKS